MPFNTKRRVEFRDTDTAGIVHFTTFFGWMEEAEHEALRSLGMSVMSRDDQEKISWPRVSASCDFCNPVRFEDIVDINVSIGKMGTKSVTYEFHLTHAGKDVARGSLTVVCCRVENGKIDSIAIPDHIRQKLQTLTSASSHN